MEWFKGGVGNAIAACRQSQALFVVYVYDDSSDSKTTDECWGNSDVVGAMTGGPYIALKLLKDSLECQQFSQLFPVFIYPSIFFIGLKGQVLVSSSGPQSSGDLVSCFSQAHQKLTAELKPPEATATPTLDTSFDETDQPGIDDTPTATPTSLASPEVEPGLDDKVERAKELIKKRRAEKDQEQFKKEKSKEIERRDLGKETAKHKKMHEDRQAQDWIKERQKQKEEARKARDEIRAKLDQDRLERAARTTATSAGRSGSKSAQPSQTPSISSSGNCRIQLKLPEGVSSVVQLERTDTLAVLRNQVTKELGVGPDQVTLTSMYPRKELGSDCDGLSMLQLELVPSGVILVRTKKSFASSLKSDGGGGGVWGGVMYVFQLIMWFLTFVKNAIAGLFGGGSSNNEEGSGRQEAEIRRERLAALGGSHSGGDGGRGIRMRKFRQEDYQDDSDEDNKQTYNGNSTQQQ